MPLKRSTQIWQARPAQQPRLPSRGWLPHSTQTTQRNEQLTYFENLPWCQSAVKNCFALPPVFVTKKKRKLLVDLFYLKQISGEWTASNTNEFFLDSCTDLRGFMHCAIDPVHSGFTLKTELYTARTGNQWVFVRQFCSKFRSASDPCECAPTQFLGTIPWDKKLKWTTSTCSDADTRPVCLFGIFPLRFC